MRGRFGRPMFPVLACIGFMACVHVGRQQEQSWRLLTLTPLAESEAESADTTSPPGPGEAEFGVGPIHLPRYLDQDQLVIRVSQNRVTLSENDRWAESLEDNIGQVLARNFSILLRSGPVILYPWPAQQRPTYQLEIEVLSFEPDTAGTAHLAARWFLRDVATRQTIAQNEADLTATAAGGSTEQSVAALSQVLGDFSVEIATVIRGLHQ